MNIKPYILMLCLVIVLCTIALVETITEARPPVHEGRTSTVKVEVQQLPSKIYESLPIPEGTRKKTFMSHWAVTNTSSAQYAYRLLCTTIDTGLRVFEDRYAVAMGTYYADYIGQKIDIQLSTGVWLKCIICEIKADKHTDPLHQYTLHDGSIVEFIVDPSKLSPQVNRSGDISHVPGFTGDIVKIYKEVVHE